MAGELVPDPRSMRASNADREQVAKVLQEAAGQNRITMEELSDRLSLAYGAKTFGELEPLTADLPLTLRPRYDAVPSAVPASAAVVVPGTNPALVSSTGVAVMSGVERKGRWTIGRRFTAVAVMGGVELDLRDASYVQPTTVINATAVMGGVDITVPEDVTVRVRGFGFMGGFGGRDQEGPPGAPVVVVKGFALMGGVQVTRKKRKPAQGELTE